MSSTYPRTAPRQHQPFVGQRLDRVPHRMPVHPEPRRQRAFGRQLVVGAIDTRCDVAAQAMGDGGPDRGALGHVTNISQKEGLALIGLTGSICLVV